MKQKELINLLDLTILTPESDKTISNFYVSDLLSWVLGKVKTPDTCLFTVVASANLVAVCSLLEINTVIFPEGVVPDETLIKLASEKGIFLASTKLSSSEALKVIYLNEAKI